MTSTVNVPFLASPNERQPPGRARLSLKPQPSTIDNIFGWTRLSVCSQVSAPNSASRPNPTRPSKAFKGVQASGPGHDASSIWRRWRTASRLLFAVQHHVRIPAMRCRPGHRHLSSCWSCVPFGQCAMNSSLVRNEREKTKQTWSSPVVPPPRAPAMMACVEWHRRPAAAL